MSVADLPHVNAALNTLATVLIVAGFVLIKQRRVAAHKACMLAAVGVSAAFLGCYLVYHFEVGSVKYPGTGALRTIYLSILLTHVVLAAAVPVLVGITVYRALRNQLERHKRIAKWTLPIWLYVSVTGVVVYWMLYQMNPGRV